MRYSVTHENVSSLKFKMSNYSDLEILTWRRMMWHLSLYTSYQFTIAQVLD